MQPLLPELTHLPLPLQALWSFFSVGFLYLSVNWIGLYTKYLTERAQRKAFLETRRSLETRFKTQKENERQERLLLSGELVIGQSKGSLHLAS